TSGVRGLCAGPPEAARRGPAGVLFSGRHGCPGTVVYRAAVYHVARSQPAEHASRPDYYILRPVITVRDLPAARLSDFAAGRICRSGADRWGIQLAGAAPYHPAAVVAGFCYGGA